MKITAADVMNMANALAPMIGPIGAFIVPGEAAAAAILGAFKGAGAMTDAQADEDLKALIVDALAAKAEAQRAALEPDPNAAAAGSGLL